MNIRRFVATDMREALAAIRADLGADAVMLSNRKISEGVEVIAAIDYDDSLLQPTGTELAAPEFGTSQLDEYEQIAGARFATREPVAAMPAAASAVATAESSMALEIKDLRRLLETQLASLAWNDLNRQAPVRARLLRELAKLGVDSSLASELAAEVPPDCAPCADRCRAGNGCADSPAPAP
jgi:flagellar biosynthesis protein FlhF